MNKRTITILSIIVLTLLCIGLFVYFSNNDDYSWSKAYRSEKREPYDIQLFQSLCARIDKNQSVEEVSVPFSVFQKNIRKSSEKGNHLFIHLGDFRSFDNENADSLMAFARMGNTALIFEEYGGSNLTTIINKLNGFSRKKYNYYDYAQPATVDETPAVLDSNTYESTTDSVSIAEVDSSNTDYIEDSVATVEPEVYDSLEVLTADTVAVADESQEDIANGAEDTTYYLNTARYVKSLNDSCVVFDFAKLGLKPKGTVRHCYYNDFKPVVTDYNYFNDSLLDIVHEGKVFERFERLGTLGQKSVMLRYKVGKGYIYLCTQPILLSNYFLKEKEGLAFFNALFDPFHKPNIYQNKHTHYEKNDSSNKNFTPLRYVLAQEPLKWAFYIFIGLLIVFFIFFSKRRQRIIPVLPFKENSTIEYVETISRLYQSKKANRDILTIMAKNFLKFIQLKYNMKSKEYNAEFGQKLSKISGIDIEHINLIFGAMDKYINMRASVSNQDLNDFYFKIKHFYNNCK
jgi:hypothetical protein